MSFAEKVKFVRTELKLSQEDLARELGVSFATINRWENGPTPLVPIDRKTVAQMLKPS